MYIFAPIREKETAPGYVLLMERRHREPKGQRHQGLALQRGSRRLDDDRIQQHKSVK